MVGARRPDVLRREFAGWDPRIESLLSQVQATFRWALYDREPLPTWTKGRLTLLGDAAHPMLPHLGQGANQSIEDGMALATILARADRRPPPQRCSLTIASAANASRRSSVARARTACATIPLTPTWACGTPRSPPTPRSASGSTTTTSSRKRKPRQLGWRNRLARVVTLFQAPY